MLDNYETFLVVMTKQLSSADNILLSAHDNNNKLINLYP